VLEPVEGALAGERRAILTAGGELAGQRRQHRIVPQLIVIHQVLIAERDAKHPLRHHRFDRMLDLRLDPTVVKARCEPRHQADRSISRTEQQRPGVQRDLTTIERSHHPAAFDHFITEQVAVTLCRHRGAPLHRDNSLLHKNLSPIQSPDAPVPVRNPG
jgi:hypothetical protein